MKILFCHGLESGPHGTKYEALLPLGDVIAPDCRGKSLVERVELIAALIQEHQPLVVGSSYGGVTAVLAAQKAGVELPGMVLCAPALERDEAPNTAPEELKALCPTTIIHGSRDEVVSVEVSKRFASRTGAKLVEVDDDHRLNDSLPVLVAEVSALI